MTIFFWRFACHALPELPCQARMKHVPHLRKSNVCVTRRAKSLHCSKWVKTPLRFFVDKSAHGNWQACICKNDMKGHVASCWHQVVDPVFGSSLHGQQAMHEDTHHHCPSTKAASTFVNHETIGPANL